jgi:hypothetical protein
MDENRRLLGIFFAQNATSLTADVSAVAIGGSFQLVVQVVALDGAGQTVCTDEHVILRAAPDGSAPPEAVPTPTRGRVGN